MAMAGSCWLSLGVGACSRAPRPRRASTPCPAISFPLRRRRGRHHDDRMRGGGHGGGGGGGSLRSPMLDDDEHFVSKYQTLEEVAGKVRALGLLLWGCCGAGLRCFCGEGLWRGRWAEGGGLS